jgi:hypothetical protein
LLVSGEILQAPSFWAEITEGTQTWWWCLQIAAFPTGDQLGGNVGSLSGSYILEKCDLDPSIPPRSMQQILKKDKLGSVRNIPLLWRFIKELRISMTGQIVRGN